MNQSFDGGFVISPTGNTVRRDRPDLIAAYRGKDVLRRASPTLDTDERRAVLGAVIEAVVIAPASGPRRIFDRDRITLTWRA